MLKVFYSGNGQMCNQILMQINVLASAYEYGYKVSYRDFRMYDGFVYCDEKLNGIITAKEKGNILLKAFAVFLIKTGIRLPHFVNASDEKAVSELLQSGKLLTENYYIYHWPFNDLTSLRKHAALIRNYFSPNEDMKKYISEKRRLYKQQGDDLIIGVHIRRKDYITWQNGAYYYNDQVYKKFMDMMYCQVKANAGSVKFLLFSDEKLDINSFNGGGYEVFIENGSAMQDFCMLANCDYLISPPSTFSGLASFLGNVSRFIIADKDDELTLERCHVWLMETDGWINPI